MASEINRNNFTH